MENNKVILFETKRIRKIWHNEEWYFSVVDVIGALTESVEPRNYWATLKKRESQLLTICQQLKMLLTADGKNYKTNCFNIAKRYPLSKNAPIAPEVHNIGRPNQSISLKYEQHDQRDGQCFS